MRNHSPHDPSLPGVMELKPFTQARILIVDDESTNVDLLKRLLGRAGFTRLDSTTDSRQAGEMFERLGPDLVLVDLHMPHMDGLQVIDELTRLGHATYLPILMLTGDIAPEARREALSRGAKDFVNKPFHADEVLLRIRTLLETRFLYLKIQSQNQALEAKVRDRTEELEAAQIEILERLASACDFRDDKTGQHPQRVGQMAALVAREIGMSSADVALIRRAAPLHDVGKISISDAILLKVGRLTPEEFTTVKTHTTIGARILSGSRFSLLKLAEEIAFTHHERWDGSGYHGMAGEGIPIVGRIVSIADVFDALTQKRPYKAAWTVEDAVAEIERQRGHQFDPAIVDAFLRVVHGSPSDS
jgi:putative two-component system response regulator